MPRSGGQMSDALSEARAEAEGHAKALPKRILLATDGSDDAALAARAAVDLAIGADAEMHVADRRRAGKSIERAVVERQEVVDVER